MISLRTHIRVARWVNFAPRDKLMDRVRPGDNKMRSIGKLRERMRLGDERVRSGDERMRLGDKRVRSGDRWARSMDIMVRLEDERV